jgi:hypothetical protein
MKCQILFDFFAWLKMPYKQGATKNIVVLNRFKLLRLFSQVVVRFQGFANRSRDL